MRIRDYEPGDAAALAGLYCLSILSLGTRHYSTAQAEAWASDAATPEETHVRCTDGRLVLVAVDGQNLPRAFIDLEPDGHIDMLFCAPEAAGTGIAPALYAALEAIALERGCRRLYVEASQASRGLFTRNGFITTRRRNFTNGGVMIHNYVMEKILPSAND